jgi:hypothetical protein
LLFRFRLLQHVGLDKIGDGLHQDCCTQIGIEMSNASMMFPSSVASESDLLLTEHTGGVVMKQPFPLPPDDDGNSADDVWGMPAFEDSSGVVIGGNSSMGNLSDAEYLERMLGPKNVGLPLLVPITLIYVIIFISGVVGNVAVCLVIVKNKSMHTATNYYLFSLAVSDLMMLALGEYVIH